MNDLQRAHDLLQLKPGATPAEVKRAFREQVAAWHPDRFSCDPAMQRRAEERLRLVIEAHRAIAAFHAARPRGGGGTGSAPSGRCRGGLPLTLGSFVRSAPNLAFCTTVLGCALLAGMRHGMTIPAWSYGMEMVLVPALFSLAYNLVARNSRVVRNLYLGFSLCALALVAVDGVVVGVDRSAPGAVQGSFDPGIHEGETVWSTWPLTREGGADFAGAGGPPASSGAPAVRAPTVPQAPVAPAAPFAPAAPAAPRAR